MENTKEDQWEGAEPFMKSFNKDPMPISWVELESKVFPEARWCVRNLIPREGLVFLASISGEGKSWLALELARSISLGTNFLGQDEFTTLPTNVLYINGEMSESEIQRRGRQLGFAPTNSNLFILSKDDFKLSEDLTKDFIWFRTYIDDKQIGVVIIDTLRSIADGLKEDRAEDVRKFMDNFKRFKNQGVAIVFLDHTRKPAQFEGKIPKKEHLLGSQDKVASVEVLIMIKNDEVTNEIHIYQRKNRLAPEINPFKVLMKDVLDVNNNIKTEITYMGEIDDADTKKEEAKDAIAELLEKRSMLTNEIIATLSNSKSKRIGQKNVRQALRELRDGGVVKSQKQGKQDLYSLNNPEPEVKVGDVSANNELNDDNK